MHFERQVTYLKQSKRLVLFLVEGVTDETVFGLALSRLIEKQKVVRFKIIEGDITSRTGTNAQNCINRVVDQVKAFLAQDIYEKGDILEVVHLVDLDGTFVSKDHIQEEYKQLPPGSHVFYTLDSILTDQVDFMIQRNEKKSEVLEKLYNAKYIYGKIPYQVYYFSCNLEHVFLNEANLDDSLKYNMSKEIEARYLENPQQLVEFLSERQIAVSDDYNQSWTMIKQEEESLKRHSNFHLYLLQRNENQ